MKEIEKIYESWCDTQKDESTIISKWCEIEEYLYESCTAPIREQIEDYIMDYGKLLERQSFLVGFQQAFTLWIEVLSRK